MEALLEKTMNHRAAIKVICDEFCISQIILHGRSRKADLVDVRRITAHILTYKFGLRGHAVARVLHRDRSMIPHYLSGFDNLIETDIALRVKYERALRATNNTTYNT
jgi:chromosomal replication initiation ATPase DnaA